MTSLPDADLDVVWGEACSIAVVDGVLPPEVGFSGVEAGSALAAVVALALASSLDRAAFLASVCRNFRSRASI
jgi:hypothetical protein